MSTRILVADDEPAITNLIAVILSGNGYDVVQTHEGAEALRLARELKPDLVMLDVMMPRLSGIHVALAIRQDPTLRDTRIVLFSSVDEDQVAWRDAGADAFLQKVFNVQKLPAFVRQVLNDATNGEARGSGPA